MSGIEHVVVIAAISCISTDVFRVITVVIVESFHERDVGTHVISVRGDIQIPDEAVADPHLNVVSSLEYAGITVVVVFHMEHWGIRVSFGQTVPVSHKFEIVVQSIQSQSSFRQDFIYLLKRVLFASDTISEQIIFRFEYHGCLISDIQEGLRSKRNQERDTHFRMAGSYEIFVKISHSFMAVSHSDSAISFCTFSPNKGEFIGISFKFSSINMHISCVNRDFSFDVVIEDSQAYFEPVCGQVVFDEALKCHVGWLETVEKVDIAFVEFTESGKHTSRGITPFSKCQEDGS